jgi:hypothetical protein
MQNLFSGEGREFREFKEIGGQLRVIKKPLNGTH